MMHLSDSGGLAEGDFDYEPTSFLLTVEKNGKTLSNTDFLKYFEKKKKSLSLLVGSVEKLFELRRYGE